jgi:hypothetical protein
MNSRIHKNGRRGQFHALEVTLVFLGWMLLLAGVWNASATTLRQQENQFLQEKAFARAQAQAHTLIEQHHTNPWNGCALFDHAKKRTRGHIIEKTCMQELTTTTPTQDVREVYVRTQSGKEIFFTASTLTPTQEENCAAIERVIRIHETSEIALLGVITCAE